ncbi:MAG: DUF4136 domain-containing protein [Firmicutes bacterium]|nr:DUF4136 domain-containing protein [Bacillota bacterium]
MRILTMTLASVALVFLTACGRAEIKYDFDSRANFAAYKTFDWMSAPKRVKGNVANSDNPLMDRRVKAAIEKDLVSKGFRLENNSDPDFLITYYPIYKERRYRTATRIGMGWGYRPWWGPRMGVSTVVSQNHSYTEGTIVVEIVDFRTNQLVWHGAAVGAMTGNETGEEAEALVSSEVARLLAGFPPRR